ncbi:uncharacterized protein [Typha latifolia]|uniref:uncharacterized protein n=1 Tax=Typha latifolia TaxID=4733 RepID=UPI003C2DCA68
MGGGQKRGRTQRRHFKQSRENVWKNGPKKTRPDEPNPNANPPWQPFATKNDGFDEYYKEQAVVPEDEWDTFIAFLRKPLPAAFRINSSGQFFEDIRSQMENDFMKSLGAEVNDEYEVEAIRPLPWYPGNLAWHLNFSRMQLRKNQALERFHEFLKLENEIGNITRQEAVSMVPPLFLDVLPDHHILDMCAAPGSKTFQLLEIIHQSIKPGLLPNGLVIANDVDVQRCNLLIHQTKRMCTANLIVTNHEAQHFPSCSLAKGQVEISKGQETVEKKILQFDRVLCDVPCSGDGTLRKAPDIWRKWNAGMGNGIHRLQVEIAMRGIASLKVGGRMVYSTCSMNPVENEAVVAEVLRRSRGSVELLDVSSELPDLVRRPGLMTWKVRDRGLWIASYNDVPLYRRNAILPSMFPSGESCNVNHTVLEDAEILDNTIGKEVINKLVEDQDHPGIECESNCSNPKEKTTFAENVEEESKLGEIPCKSVSHEDAAFSKAEFSSFPLQRCMRILPHDQNSGAFFIAVLQKVSPLHASLENRTSKSTNIRRKHCENMNVDLKDENQSEILPSEDALDNCQISDEADADLDLSDKKMETNLSSDDMCAKDKTSMEGEKYDNVESGHVETKDIKRMESKWRGVDPVVFFTDEMTINSIISFYGISGSFPLSGHLVTRNHDANHVKRIYYVSKSVNDLLQLNFQVGQRLKITSLGLKIFERQSSKDGSPCSFRLSSEGLPLLLPYISKQNLCASLVDFQHLLQYRVVKFADFVDAKLGEEASNLMPGCCVVMLREGNHNADTIVVDPSTIAIICWKGKTNLSIMVSQLDGRELLDRLAVRFGTGGTSSNNGDNCNLEMTINAPEDIKSTEGIETTDQEIVP